MKIPHFYPLWGAYWYMDRTFHHQLLYSSASVHIGAVTESTMDHTTDHIGTATKFQLDLTVHEDTEIPV